MYLNILPRFCLYLFFSYHGLGLSFKFISLNMRSFIICICTLLYTHKNVYALNRNEVTHCSEPSPRIRCCRMLSTFQNIYLLSWSYALICIAYRLHSWWILYTYIKKREAKHTHNSIDCTILPLQIDICLHINWNVNNK